LTGVWITRAEPGATATAARLRVLGFEPVIAPLIETRPLPAKPDLAGVAALAFTSAAGVAAFAAVCATRDLPVFAVGEVTAAAAHDAGWTEVTCADGDVAALARLITAERPRIAGAVLHAGAAAPAGDLVGALTRAGLSARFLAVYETVAEVLAGGKAANLAAYCLSPAVAATLRPARIERIFTAAMPNEDALLSLLADQAMSGES
jgi:uroporphyrinogen-III synthase